MKSLLTTKKCLPLVGAHNGLVARLAAEAGFEACYISGGALSASSGQPDIGILSLEDFCRKIKEVKDSAGLPVFADADTGFGSLDMVHKTLVEYWRAGASGFHIEDQEFPKRCGHLSGKTLVSEYEMQKKIETAKKASVSFTQEEFLVCARTDAFALEGLEGVLSRSFKYIEAGADMVFTESLSSSEVFQAVGAELNGKTLLMANMTEFGKTPLISVEEFEKWGYSAVLFPVSTLRVAMHSVSEFLKDLKQTGTQQAWVGKMQTRESLYRTLKYNSEQELWEFPKSTK